MTRHDLFWCLGGLALGLGIAANTYAKHGYGGSSFNAGQMTGNVVGGILVMFAVGRLVRWLGRKG